ncbi:MAG: ATP-binding protein [Candidatus Micrarchaeia archaeon]
MTIPTKKEIMDFSPMNLGEKEELPEYKRDAYYDIENLFKSGLIIAITGLRRVGKTTLIKQLFEKKAFYFSFDEKKYLNAEALKKVIDSFLEEKEKPVIILDEIFRIGDWSGIIKKYHDQKKARFIVSGSSALLIKKGMESLSGRLFEYYVPPLFFREYLELTGKKLDKLLINDRYKIKKRYAEECQEFLKKGSFPEIIKMDEKMATDYIKTTTIEKIVFDDIPTTFRIEYPSKLYDLLRICANNSSKLFTDVNMSEALGISRHTVSDYLLYLKKAYLIDIIYPKGSLQKAIKKQKKIFVKTASIYSSLSENPNIGQAAETAVYDKLSREKISFYRDLQKREIDFILDTKPIEVKYQTDIINADLSNLLYFIRKNKKENGLLITKNTFDEKIIDGKKITMIPLDVFLLTEM